MIIGTHRIHPKAQRRGEVLEVFRSIMGPVQAQPGCLGFHIYEEQGPDEAVVLVEQWESQATLETHLRSEAYRRILAAIELAGTPPQITFDVVSSSEGMDLIERSRNPVPRTDGDLHQANS